jgi:deferrochelatase/peroxidase EfeB
MLRVASGSDVTEVRNALKSLWQVLANLEKGIVPDLDINVRHRRTEGLSVLVGYGPKMFDILGAKKKCPTDLNYSSLNSPLETGGGEVIHNSGLRYASDITENHTKSNHIVLQIIADSEFATTRAVVEIWKEIHRQTSSNGSKNVLNLSKIYTGFQSPNKRSWLGFHDGVSNIRADQRLKAIAIDSASLSKQDKWLYGGTYLAFLRMAIDLELWETLSVSEQELVIGRDKLTGCPLVGVDRYNKPVKDMRCPIRGTFEIIESGNEQFRTHPPYGYQKNKPYGIKDDVLKNSHIGLTTQSDAKQGSKISQIFRQGFQFFEPTDENHPFRVGINFVSYQKSVQTIHEMLRYGFLKTSPLETGKKIPTFNEIVSVRSAGIFVVPPFNDGEFFPGESIFTDLYSSDRSRYQYRLNALRTG